MGWLSKAGKLIQRLTCYVCALSMFILIPMMLLTTTDVLGRTLFPLYRAVELSVYARCCDTYGLGVYASGQGHPRITLVVSRLPVQLQAALEILVNLLSLFIIFIVIWQGWVLATGRMAAIVSDVLKISQFPFRLLISAGSILLFLEVLVDLMVAIAKFSSSFTGDKGGATVREQGAGSRK